MFECSSECGFPSCLEIQFRGACECKHCQIECGLPVFSVKFQRLLQLDHSRLAPLQDSQGDSQQARRLGVLGFECAGAGEICQCPFGLLKLELCESQCD